MSGQLLISLDGNDQVATNDLGVTANDVFVLSVAATGSGTSTGSAALLMRGPDVGLSGSDASYKAPWPCPRSAALPTSPRPLRSLAPTSCTPKGRVRPRSIPA